MRRLAVFTAALALGLCGPAAAFFSGYLTLDPKDPGAGTRATIDVHGPGANYTFDFMGMRFARGTKWHNRAVGRRCRNARAAVDDCPGGSRIGAGTASLQATRRGPLTRVDIDLYLARRKLSEDAARVLMVTRAPGRTGFATGRVFELNPDIYRRKGLQLQLQGLRKAFFGIGVRDWNVHFAAHRKVEGRRVDLITNPRTCTADGWPWTIAIGSLHSSQSFYHGAVDCSG